MLTIVSYQTSKCLKDLSFIKFNEHVVIITPGPQIADNIRSNVQRPINCSKFDVITIASFITWGLGMINPEYAIIRKERLLLLLSRVWIEFFGDRLKELFYQAFEILTELRSYSVSLEVMFDIIKKLPPSISDVVLVMWNFLMQEGTLDEQMAYTIISQEFKNSQGRLYQQESNEIEVSSYIFWSFERLSAIQIDLLQSLAIRNSVYVIVPEMVLKNSMSSDWISWLASHSNIIELKGEPFGLIKSKIYSYNSLELGSLIKELIAKEQFQKLISISSDLGIKVLVEFPSSRINLKSSIDLFCDEINAVSIELREVLAVGTKLNNEDLFSYITNQMNGSLNQERYLRYKVLELYSKNLELIEWSCQDNLDYSSEFLRQLALLQAPRNSYVSFGSVASVSRKELVFQNEECKSLLIIESGDLQMALDNSLFSSDIRFDLSVIGPRPRTELQTLFVEAFLREFESNSNNTILINQASFEISEIAKRYCDNSSTFSKNVLQEKKLSSQFNGDKMRGADPHRSHSATSLQSYYDCPRKYYAIYIKNLKLDISSTLTLSQAQIGSVAHRVMATRFFNQKRDLDQQIMGALKKEFSKDLLEIELERSLISIRRYVNNGIDEINKICDLLKVEDPFKSASFEHKIRVDNLKGSIDLFIKRNDGNILIDFKKSSASIPSLSDLIAFKKIQLPFYLAKVPSVSFCGYINLYDPEDSLYLAETSSSIAPNKEIKVNEIDISAWVNGYQRLENLLIDRLDHDMLFEARPMSEECCRYCPIMMVCTDKKIRGDL